MPKAARETFGSGLVQREAARVTALLEDAQTTAVHLVTLAEDMPVSETLETHAQLTQELHLPLGRVVVNRLHERRFDRAHLQALLDAAEQAPERDQAILSAVAERAAEETGWAAINAEHLARLEAAIGTEPIVRVPYLFTEEFGSAELDVVSRILADAIGDAAQRARQASS
jgi:anion-transporting  ArsA/GET3 family ATPase